MKLTIERLNGEYLNWAIEHGNGRNGEDLRFGQYISNKYKLDENCPNVFYYEGVEFTYNSLLEYLHISGTKNTL